MTFYQLRTLLADPKDLLEVFTGSRPSMGQVARHREIKGGQDIGTTLRLIGREGLLGGTQTR